MLAEKPIMGWNSWNTFGKDINEELICKMADIICDEGYKDAGYEYVIIDDCWSLKQRVDGKITPDPKLFPHGMKYVADYIHSKGLKFGMYSCAGTTTCAGYPGSYGYEFEDAKQFAEWGVDYLKYDFCNFPKSADCKNAYLTMAMALRNCGRDIVFAACNWGMNDPAKWMRSHGAHTYRSTGDIFDNRKSFTDIFISQIENVEGNAPGCFNDIDMLIVGMHAKGNVGLGGCTSEEYFQHFALWAFLGSPLIIGADLRNISAEDKETLLNKGLIAINQDKECRPPFVLFSDGGYNALMKILSDGKFAIIFTNTNTEKHEWSDFRQINFDDCGIHSNTPHDIKITDAVSGEELGLFRDYIRLELLPGECKVFVCELC